MRTSVDEEPQIQTVAIAQALLNVSSLERFDRRVGRDEMLGMAGTCGWQYSIFWSSCQSSCTVISDLSGSKGTFTDKKKALER
jgi:hypothetical protein